MIPFSRVTSCTFARAGSHQTVTGLISFLVFEFGRVKDILDFERICTGRKRCM